jgi:protein arginine kinase activator
MICSICKNNKATIHIKDIFLANSEETKESEVHVCRECAFSNNLYSKHLELNTPSINNYDELVTTENSVIKQKKIKKTNKTIICKTCGYSLEEFKATNTLSCNACYENFDKYILKLVKKIHGENKHIGRSPHKIRYLLEKDSIKKILEHQLTDLVKKEEYEKAAQIRDNINKLKDEQ